jgi:NADH-quinone oxidoreductase subunit N
MYLEDAEGGAESIDVRKIFGATSVALAVPTLVIGVYWGPVYDFVARSLAMIR